MLIFQPLATILEIFGKVYCNALPIVYNRGRGEQLRLAGRIGRVTKMTTEVFEVLYWAGETVGVFATEAEAWAASAKAYGEAKAAGPDWASKHGTPQTVIRRYSRGWVAPIGGHGQSLFLAKAKRAAAPSLSAK